MKGPLLKSFQRASNKHRVCRHFTNAVGSGKINDPEPGSEYRGRNLPLFKVTTQDQENDEINVYIDAISGQVVAIRSEQWRLFGI